MHGKLIITTKLQKRHDYRWASTVYNSSAVPLTERIPENSRQFLFCRRNGVREDSNTDEQERRSGCTNSNRNAVPVRSPSFTPLHVGVSPGAQALSYSAVKLCGADPPTLRTDGQTDRQTDDMRSQYRALQYIVHRAVKTVTVNFSATQQKNRNSLVNGNNNHCADVSRTLMAAETMYSPRRSVQFWQTITALTSLERWRQHSLCTRRSVQLRHTISALTPEEQRQTMVRWTGTTIIT